MSKLKTKPASNDVSGAPLLPAVLGAKSRDCLSKGDLTVLQTGYNKFFARCDCKTDCPYQNLDSKDKTASSPSCAQANASLKATNFDPAVVNPGLCGDFGGMPDPFLLPGIVKSSEPLPDYAEAYVASKAAASKAPASPKSEDHPSASPAPVSNSASLPEGSFLINPGLVGDPSAYSLDYVPLNSRRNGRSAASSSVLAEASAESRDSDSVINPGLL